MINIENKWHYCPYCGSRAGPILGMTRIRKVTIMIILAVINFTLIALNSYAVIVTIPLIFLFLFVFMSYPKWEITLPSDKWV